MAALTTMALLALSAAKTTSTYMDQQRQAGAVSSQADYEANILDRNAGYSDQLAGDEIARGRQQESQSRGAARRLAGSQRASMAAEGLDLNSGSPADVVANDQTLSEVDALTIRNNARRAAWGYTVQAGDQRQQASLTRQAGRNTADSIRRASVGTLLSGAGELANIYSASPKGINRGTVSSTVQSMKRPPVPYQRTSF